MKSATTIFTELGERLAAFGTDAPSSAVIARAAEANGWFTADEVRRAVAALCDDMLQSDKLRQWLSSYDLSGVRPRRVAVIMAGNIPLVGFFDLMCVLACGHAAIVKPSAKDRVLTEYVVGLLREIEPGLLIEIVDDASVAACEADAAIAMGGDNTKRHLRSMFAGKPALLRGNRHSVAVLSGRESESELAALAEDVFRYSGLGCRNVSLIFVPHGYELRLPNVEVNPKYRNNYRQNRALLTMQGVRFTDTGTCLLVAGREFPTSISTVAVAEYDDLREVVQWLAEHDGELQCVVSECVDHSRRTEFGQAQHPTLTDYPDDADVMRFLTRL